MLLDRVARVWAEWEITSTLPEDVTTAQVWLDGAWRTAELLTSPARVRVLIAGPDAPDVDLAPDAVVLPLGVHAPRVRIADVPEEPATAAGVIIVA